VHIVKAFSTLTERLLICIKPSCHHKFDPTGLIRYQMLNLVLFGPPGAGKGTQSEKLINKYKLIHLSTGDILRSEISMGTDLGLEAKKLMDQGLLVPDEVVIGMISNKLDSHKEANGFIFDGFPRTVAQAEALDKLLQSKNSLIAGMIALVVNDEELEKRLLNRGKNSGRPDDKFTSINGIGTVDEIFNSICAVIDSF
jgi:adenylate kinase